MKHSTHREARRCSAECRRRSHPREACRIWLQPAREASASWGCRRSRSSPCSRGRGTGESAYWGSRQRRWAGGTRKGKTAAGWSRGCWPFARTAGSTRWPYFACSGSRRSGSAWCCTAATCTWKSWSVRTTTAQRSLRAKPRLLAAPRTGKRSSTGCASCPWSGENFLWKSKHTEIEAFAGLDTSLNARTELTTTQAGALLLWHWWNAIIVTKTTWGEGKEKATCNYRALWGVGR